MARITITDLRKAIDKVNVELAESKSCYYLKEQGRNGYQAVDVYVINDKGAHKCSSNLVCGTSRECIHEVYTYIANYYGYIYPYKSLNELQLNEINKRITNND